jgi:phosphate transporter
VVANIGGMITPISSPQNAIAVDYMDPKISWLSWLAVTVPLSILCLLACWLALLLYYRPGKSTPFVQPIRSSTEPLNRSQYFVLLITLTTIVLWLLEVKIREWVGHSGIIGLFPMIMFFGSGILSKDDFNSFPWTVVMLAMGGISLGAGVKNTHLLESITGGIKDTLSQQPYFVALLTFCSITLVIATFISHTVSAVILLPLVREVGMRLPGGSTNLLVLGAGIMCSGAMGLPISGFPNITAVSLEDATGEPYVRTRDFLRIGVPMSIVVCLLTVSVGYGLMLMVGI